MSFRPLGMYVSFPFVHPFVCWFVCSCTNEGDCRKVSTEIALSWVNSQALQSKAWLSCTESTPSGE